MEPIAALATPPGIGAIALIRLSGDGVFSVADRVIRSKTKPSESQPRKVYRGIVVDPRSGEEIDDVLFWTFRAPKSYTGEDMVEVSTHGGLTVSNMVLNAFLRAGARLARRGEFTQRAFLNGKIDLMRARGVLDLIEAKTERGVKLARRKLDGWVSSRLTAINDRLLELAKEIEASINFEEDFGDVELQHIHDEIAAISSELEKFIDEGKSGRAYLFGARVVIVGRPNAGKSTLFNAILGRERAIVTEIPGTTRDVVSEEILIGGMPVKLMDTAGLRETEDIVERIGVEFAIRTVEESDLAILVVDATLGNYEDELEFISDIDLPIIIALNKMDLVNEGELRLPDEFQKHRVVRISAASGAGVDELLNQITEVLHLIFNPESGFALSDFELNVALSALLELDQARRRLEEGYPVDIASHHILRATADLSKLLGLGAIEDEILDRIFSDFCIGK